ncbi:hypothetical protein B0H14DRAFT_226564 [Mycena olivaceomarginata]|nr:hypothetical protein B0H14DRAFT_226564 [Mycena olivaceomarginata]
MCLRFWRALLRQRLVRRRLCPRMIILLSGCYSVLKCAFLLPLTIFLRCLSILSVYYLSLVLCSRFAGYLAINASLTSYIRSSLYVGVLEMVWEYLEIHSTSSAGCAPPSSSSPRLPLLATRCPSPAFGSLWVSTATPSLAARTKAGQRFYFSARRGASSPPCTYPMPSSLRPPTQPSHASIHGRDFVICTHYLPRIPVILESASSSGAARVSIPVLQLG